MDRMIRGQGDSGGLAAATFELAPVTWSFRQEQAAARVDVYWLPLGAGGWFVRLNGRVYEAVKALLGHRQPLDLYHTALEVRLPEGRFVIENCWPIPDADPAARGVVVEGPVGSRRMGRFRTVRYEVRRWRDGVIADADQAVASPQLVSDDPLVARRLLDLVGALPSPVWGRDELQTGEMWNSNSVISWLLARSGLPMDVIRPPAGGRAPGWDAGVITARRQHSDLPVEHDAQRVAGSASAPGTAVAALLPLAEDPVDRQAGSVAQFGHCSWAFGA
jgi:hypothetical protein